MIRPVRTQSGLWIKIRARATGWSPATPPGQQALRIHCLEPVVMGWLKRRQECRLSLFHRVLMRRSRSWRLMRSTTWTVSASRRKSRRCFEPGTSQYFKHPLCQHLFLEFPRGPVGIDGQYPVIPDEIEMWGMRPNPGPRASPRADRFAGTNAGRRAHPGGAASKNRWRSGSRPFPPARAMA